MFSNNYGNAEETFTITGFNNWKKVSYIKISNFLLILFIHIFELFFMDIYQAYTEM